MYVQIEIYGEEEENKKKKSIDGFFISLVVVVVFWGWNVVGRKRFTRKTRRRNEKITNVKFKYTKDAIGRDTKTTRKKKFHKDRLWRKWNNEGIPGGGRVDVYTYI